MSWSVTCLKCYAESLATESWQELVAKESGYEFVSFGYEQNLMGVICERCASNMTLAQVKECFKTRSQTRKTACDFPSTD